jgi:ABC-2 type transport system permease protein
MAAARGDVARIGLPLALVWSNGLFAYLLAAASARLLYRRGYDIIAGSGGSRRVYRSGRLDQVARWLVGYLDRPTRLLVEKDFRTFRRDPGQWAQILVFAGLVLFYFLNFRRFYQADIGKPFQNGISLLNLSATAMLMCAYMGRFVYPMLSLEGRKFWVLGLLPLPRTKLLIGKFAFAATGSVLIAEVLIIVSDLLLGMPPGLVLIHALAVLVIALGLSGMSVGLGAAMPNFREADGSKIAVGFGGTLNLILSLLYLVLVIALMAGPYHAALALELADRNGVSAAMAFRAWIIPGVVLGVLVGVVAVLVPMRLGARSLRRMEF